MKWLFILLLLMNVGYFGWQFNQQLTQPVQKPAAVPLRQNGDVPELKLLSEVQQPLERGDSPENPGTGQALAQPSDDKATREQAAQEKEAKEKEVLKEIDAIVQEVAVLTEQPEGSAAHATTGDAPSERLCRRIGPFSSRQRLSGFRVAHKDQFVTYAERADKQNVRTRYWVYLGPYKSTRAAQLRLNQLLRKGVRDYWLIQGGNMENAISLGIYDRKESVQNRLQELKDIGYSASAKPEYKTANIYWLDAELAKNSKLTGLPSGVEAKDVACETIAIANKVP